MFAADIERKDTGFSADLGIEENQGNLPVQALQMHSVIMDGVTKNQSQRNLWSEPVHQIDVSQSILVLPPNTVLA